MVLTATRRILIERWLWNVEALERWETPRPRLNPPVLPNIPVLPNLLAVPNAPADPNLPVAPAAPNAPVAPNVGPPAATIDWWTPAKQATRQLVPRLPDPPPPADAPADLPNIFVPAAFTIGEFVGQGRKMGYQGLAIDFLTSIYDERQNPRSIPDIARATDTKLNTGFRRPAAWWALAWLSLILFWWGICMAFVVSYQTPTVGLSCRSGSYLLYGLFASVTWVICLLRKSPGEITRAVCYLVNLLSCLVLAMVVLAQVSVITYCTPRLPLQLQRKHGDSYLAN